jgi:hypothetical protein
MIDHASREQLLIALDPYLSDNVDVRQFCESLQGIRVEDIAVRRTLEYLDDTGFLELPSSAAIDKETWDGLQRWRLVLASGAAVDERFSYVWRWPQAAAACWFFVGGTLYLAGKISGNFYLSIAGMLTGLGVLKLSEIEETLQPADPWRSFPFNSPSSIAQAMHRAPEFRKQRSPRVVKRPQPSRAEAVRNYVFAAVFLKLLSWVGSPALLPALAVMPIKIDHTRVVDDS